MDSARPVQNDELLAELQFYKSALDAHAIVAITDSKGRITYVNEKFCEVSGYTRDELLGQDHRILNSGYHPKSFFRDMYATISRGRIWQGEIRNRAKNGRLYWVSTTIVPMLDRHGSVSAYVAIRQDITERMKVRKALVAAKEAAEAANRAKDEFLANVSHEIRTPLLAITGFAELLGDPEIAASDREKYVNAVRRQSEHLLMLINDLLDASKIDAGSMTLEAIAVPIASMLNEVDTMMRLSAERRGIAFSIDHDADIPSCIRADPLRLRQVLVNLVSNAIKFTNEGSVRLHARAQHNAAGAIDLAFEVHDTGIGMTPETVSRLFQRFSQADTSTTRNFGGTGIGLYLSNRLAEMMNGEITVASTPGAGSTFTLILHDVTVIEPAATPAPTSSDLSPAGKRPLEGLHIVLAEDGPDNQVLLRFWLTKAGATVTVVDDGQKACKAAGGLTPGERPPELILMDLQMPVMDGFEATQTIRASGLNVPILALTAGVTPAHRTRAAEVGFDGFIAKPITRAELIATCVRYALGSRSAA